MPSKQEQMKRRAEQRVAHELLDGAAACFHFEYEHLAPAFNYETRLESRVTWDKVPKNNRALMRAVVLMLCRQHVIVIPGLDIEIAEQEVERGSAD